MLEAVERAREDQAKVKTHFESYKCEPCRVQALSAKDWTAFVTCSCRASRTLPGWLMRTRVRALPWNRGLRRLLRRSLPLMTHTCLLVARRKRGQMHPQGVGVIRHKAEPVRTGPIIVRSDAVEFTAFAHGQEPKPGKHALLASALAPATFSLHHDTETIKTKTAAEPDANSKRAQHLGTSHKSKHVEPSVRVWCTDSATVAGLKNRTRGRSFHGGLGA